MKMTRRFSGYIWEREDWPNFQWNPEVLLDPLERLSRQHGQLYGCMAMLGKNEQDESMLSSLTDELMGTSEIEGVLLRRDSVRSSLARKLGIDCDGTIVEDHSVDGLAEVMVDAIRNCEEPLSKERLFDWHAALFPLGRSGMYKITVAGWRKGDEPMQVVSGAFGHEKVHYEAPPSTAVEKEMSRLIEWCNAAEFSPFILAGVLHLWFLTIHPFDDGNGRMARTLTDMILARLDTGGGRYYSMSAEINRNKKEYYDVLERTQKGDMDITEWLLWFFGCMESAISYALDIVATTMEKSRYWDRFRATDVNERQRKVINRLWDGFDGKLTTSKWAKICHCSQDTALRDIHDLIAKGMLRDSGASGRSTHYLLP